MVEKDQPGRELESDARVWREYVRTACLHDDKLTEGWNASLDVILIFVSHLLRGGRSVD